MKQLFVVAALFLLFANVEAQEPTFTANTSLVIIDANVRDKAGRSFRISRRTTSRSLKMASRRRFRSLNFSGWRATLFCRKCLRSSLSLKRVRPPPRPGDSIPGPPPGGDAFRFQHHGGCRTEPHTEAALKFVREQMKPADLVAILSATPGPLKMVPDFTTDKDHLEEVVKSFQIGRRANWPECRAMAATARRAKTPARRSTPMRPSSTSSTRTETRGAGIRRQDAGRHFRRRRRWSIFRAGLVEDGRR